MTEYLLEFSELKCGYAGIEIVHGISSGVKRAETLGIFGRNGVGKTTLARVLNGEIAVGAGEIKLQGQNINKKNAYARRRMGVSLMPQTGMVFDSLSVRENLALANSTSVPDQYFEIFPRLAERLDQQAGSMSGGERKILSFVRVMLEETHVTILDEPSEGVQPENIERMQACIQEKQAKGHAFILIEQNINMLMAVSDKYLGLDSGRKVFEKNSNECVREDLLTVLAV